jgi:hypothetical protein
MHSVLRRVLILAAATGGGLASSSLSGAELTTDGIHTISQADLGGAVEQDDHFASVLAAGDFDGDGRMDLAIGDPDENVGGVVDAGEVIVVYGAASGLGQAGARAPIGIHQNVTDVGDVAEAGDHFGAALATGDFNGDGRDDLAVGVPGEDCAAPAAVDCGLVQIFPGSATGIDRADDTVWTQENLGSPAHSPSEVGDELGFALARCNRNLDAYDDLVVGIPGENSDTGAVVFVLGFPTGLDPAVSVSWAGTGTTDAPQAGDRFGSAIACAELDASVTLELVVGAPSAELGDCPGDCGALWVQRGSGAVVALATERVGDEQGASLALRHNRHLTMGRATIAGGAPGYYGPGPTLEQAGAVVLWRDVFSGAPSFVYRTQGDNGPTLETQEPFDRFAEELAVGDFQSDGVEDLVVGVPRENLGDFTPGVALDAGVVQVLYGRMLDEPDVVFSIGCANCRFGSALAAGDFDGDGYDDLAVGAPGQADLGISGAGMLWVLYSDAALLRDGFDGGNVNRWSLKIPL